MNQHLRGTSAVQSGRAMSTKLREEAAIDALADRLLEASEELGDHAVERYREEIPDYRTLDEGVLYGDVLRITLDNLRALLESYRHDARVRPEHLDEFRASAARRVHQGVSLDSLLHAYRLWGQTVWETTMACARTDRASEGAAALLLVGRLMEHLDVASGAVARAYLDRAQGVWTDREAVRRDLLDALICGKATVESARRQAASLDLELADSYAVLIACRDGAQVEIWEPQSASQRAALRRALDAATRRLAPAAGSVLTGLRHGEVVALYPVHSPSDGERLRDQAAELARALAPNQFSVGLGTAHDGLDGVPESYREAREAVDIALSRGLVGAPLAFDEVLIDHMLRSSAHADRLVDVTLGPLRAYDSRRGGDLMATLRAYLQSGFSVTRAAEALFVHPNTVVYRLRRVREITGRDPLDLDDLLVLALALKLEGVT